MSYVYLRSEKHTFTVGFFDPEGKWVPESDHEGREEAADRVSFLNGGKPARLYSRRGDEAEGDAPMSTILNERLLNACIEQQQAIDTLFAMLIAKTMHSEKPFYPSESGQPWIALLLGNEAIKAAKAEAPSAQPQSGEPT